MTPADAAALLTIAAAFDNRRPDPDAAQAWALALNGLRFEDCRDAVVEHYQESSDWLMPSRVIGKVKKIRNQRVLSFGTLPDPPAELETWSDFIAWQREMTERVADGVLTRENYVAPALTARRMPDLGSLTKRIPEEDAPTTTRPGDVRGTDHTKETGDE